VISFQIELLASNIQHLTSVFRKVNLKVTKKIYSLLIALALLASLVSASAQNRQAAASGVAANDPLRLLPVSDAVFTIDIKRLITETMPRVFANDPAKLAKVNAEIDNFKTRYGLDPRSFERVAVGVRFNTRGNITTTDTVAVARGSFNAAALVAAGRLAAPRHFTEQKYGGKTIYTFNINDQVKMLGLVDVHVRDLAISALDSNTIAIGEPDRVRATIDATHGTARVSNDLVELATRTPHALIGFGANIPLEASRNINVGNADTSRTLASVRQAYGAISSTDAGFDLMTVARTETAEQAKNLGDTIDGAKILIGFWAAGQSGPKGRLAQNVLESLKYSTQGNEVQITLKVAQADINTLMTTLGGRTE